MQSWISRKSPVGFYPAVIPQRDNFCLEVAMKHWVSSPELSAMGKCCLSFPFPTSWGPECPRTATGASACSSVQEEMGSFLLPACGDSRL